MHVGSHPSWSRTPDGAVAIGIFAALLLLIPSTQVLPGLRAIGSLAHVMAWGLLLWWIAEWLAYRHRALDPVSKAMGAMVLVALASYAVGMTLPLHEDQIRAADRGLVVVLTGIGVVLVAAQGIQTLRQLNAVILALVCLGGVVGAIALVQFATGLDIGSIIKVPLLNQMVTNAGMADVRFGFVRTNATAAHPIELGVVMAALSPLGLHLIVQARRLWIAVPTSLMLLAIPTTLSRSGFIALTVGIVVVMLSWSWLDRLVVLSVMGVLGLLAVVVRPGLGEGVVDLFTLAGSDDSILGRTSDYDVIGGYLQTSPLFGTGLGTFLPERFIILDNQFLLTLIDMGAIGLITLVVLLGTAVMTCASVSIRSRSGALSRMAIAVAASLAAIIVSLGFFDALSFGMVTGLLWILLGLSGATWHIMRSAPLDVWR